MFYGYKCANEDKNWEGSAGCWGVLAFSDKSRHVLEINYRIDSSYSNGSMAAKRVEELRKADPKLTLVEAKGIAFEELCDAVLRGRVKYKLSHRDSNRTKGEQKWWVDFTDFQDMPKNHLMFLLFALRSACAGNHAVHYDELRKRGVKSFRKMVVGCSMFCQQSGMNGLTGLVSVPSGGRIFLTPYTTLADIKSFYRGSKLQGPTDGTWAMRGGYTSGLSGRCVQLSGCGSVITSATDSRINLKKNHPVKVEDYFPTLNRVSGNKDTLSKLLDDQAAFLKALK